MSVKPFLKHLHEARTGSIVSPKDIADPRDDGGAADSVTAPILPFISHDCPGFSRISPTEQTVRGMPR